MFAGFAEDEQLVHDNAAYWEQIATHNLERIAGLQDSEGMGHISGRVLLGEKPLSGVRYI